MRHAAGEPGVAPLPRPVHPCPPTTAPRPTRLTHIALHFDGGGHGEDIVVLTGRARQLDGRPARRLPEHVAKYEQAIMCSSVRSRPVHRRGAVAGVASVAVIAVGRGNRKAELPFGPFMIAGALLAVFAGPSRAHRYLYCG